MLKLRLTYSVLFSESCKCLLHTALFDLYTQETDNIFVFLVGKIYMFNDCLRAISDLSDHCDTY